MHAFSVVSDSLQPHGLQPPRLLCPWDFPGKNTGVVCHFLLQGIFLTQGSNLCLLSLLRWQVDSFTTVPSESKIYHPKICLFGMRITVDWLFFKKKKKKTNGSGRAFTSFPLQLPTNWRKRMCSRKGAITIDKYSTMWAGLGRQGGT